MVFSWEPWCVPSALKPGLDKDGEQSHNTFTITNLLVPRQEGTTDTCMTTHEEEQFAYQDERDLMTLGWVCPVLPIDLSEFKADKERADTYAPDTDLLHEQPRPAHARVISGHARRSDRRGLRPQTRAWLRHLSVRSRNPLPLECELNLKIFNPRRLTDPPGLETIVTCELPGLFHPQCAFYSSSSPWSVTYSLSCKSGSTHLHRAPPSASLPSAISAYDDPSQDTDHGHVQLRADAKFESVDLRRRK